MAGQKTQDLGRECHESFNCETDGTDTKAQYSAANFKTKREFWEGISQGQNNLGQLGSGSFQPNTITDEKPVLNPLDREIRGSINQPYERLPEQGGRQATPPEITLLKSELEYSLIRDLKVDKNTFGQENNAGSQLNRTGANNSKGIGVRNLFAKGLSVIDIRNILGELCEAEMNGITVKNDTSIGRRKMMRPNSPRRIVNIKDAKMDGTLGDITEMIVREADCGLKHPKPLRLTETRRIISMCRGGVPGTPQLWWRAMPEPVIG